MDFCIATRGERIKEFRKELGLKQEEISGRDVTRNLISMIETNKVPLSEKAAKIIYLNLKKIIERKKLSIEEHQLKELFVSEESRAKEIFHNFLELMDIENYSFQYEIFSMVEVLDKYNLLEEKTLLYLKVGEKLFIQNHIEKAYKYYLMAYEIGITLESKEKELIQNIWNFGQVIIKGKKINQANLNILEQVRDKFKGELDVKEESILLYHIGNVMLELDKHREAAVLLNEFKQRHRNYYKKLQLEENPFFILGKCYGKIGKSKKALKIFDDLYNLYSNKETSNKASIIILMEKIKIFNSIGVDQMQCLKELIERIEQEKSFYEEEEAPRVFMEIGEVFQDVFIYKNALEYYKFAKKLSGNFNKKISEKSLEKYLEIGVILQDSSIIEEVRIEILGDIKRGVLSNNSPVIKEILKYFIAKGEKDKVISMLKFCNRNI